MGPPTAVIALLANRAWHSVGLISIVLGRTRNEALLAEINYLQIVIVIAFGVLVWLLLRRDAHRYQTKHVSEQMLKRLRSCCVQRGRSRPHPRPIVT